MKNLPSPAILVRNFHEARASLAAFRSLHFRKGQFVRVNSARFKGIGCVSFIPPDLSPDQIPVLLENGNVWHYPINDITEIITNLADVPRDLRRTKLRWHGYSLLEITRRKTA